MLLKDCQVYLGEIVGDQLLCSTLFMFCADFLAEWKIGMYLG